MVISRYLCFEGILYICCDVFCVLSTRKTVQKCTRQLPSNILHHRCPRLDCSILFRQCTAVDLSAHRKFSQSSASEDSQHSHRQGAQLFDGIELFHLYSVHFLPTTMASLARGRLAKRLVGFHTRYRCILESYAHYSEQVSTYKFDGFRRERTLRLSNCMGSLPTFHGLLR
jgi:hypothetical protein